MRIVESAMGVIRTLDRYAGSPSFLGYFEASSREQGTLAVDLFLGFFGEMWSRGSLLVSIAESVARVPAQTAEVREALARLGAAGWLSPVDERSDKDFRVIPLSGSDRRLVRELCELTFEGFLFGHTFFFWSEERLVVYPHDDRGFGVFAAPGAAGKQIGRRFLRQAEKDPAFSADVRR
jgi:hypothetical protein